jgi:hypothetical protein
MTVPPRRRVDGDLLADRRAGAGLPRLPRHRGIREGVGGARGNHPMPIATMNSVRRLLASWALVAASAGCGDAAVSAPRAPDAGALDVGTPDVGTPDVGPNDLGAPDAGAPDGGASDAASRRDAAAPDALGADASARDGGATHAIQTVFVVLMENHNWSDIHGSASAPYINATLLPMGAHAEAYANPPRIHPSEPNYLWLEAGGNLGVLNDNLPAQNHQATDAHLVTQLERAGISWRSYQEGIDGTTCPLTNRGLYAPKHNPMVFFDDVTRGNDPTSPRCIAHVRPYEELARDLAAGTVARYNFITPDLCHDMHNSTGCATSDSVRNGDTWLATALPPILASAAYRDGGVILLTWDESERGDFPIGMIVLSPLARAGYANTVPYDHGSTLRTVEEIFDVPPLRAAAVATDLSDLFRSFP